MLRPVAGVNAREPHPLAEPPPLREPKWDWLRARFLRWYKRLAVFFVGQGLTQVISLSTGLLLLRWLSVDSYAQYGVAFGFQCTVALLVDFGLCNSIVAMVGSRGADARVVGGYIRAGRAQRNRLLLLVVPVSAVAFHVVAKRQHWALATELLLFGGITANLFLLGLASFYSAPLLIHQRMRLLSKSQVLGATSRLGACWLAHLASSLDSVGTVWFGGLSAGIIAFLSKRASQPLFEEPEQADPAVCRELMRYITPLMPSVIYYAFQGQISVFIIGYFGHSKNVAEVAALGRLGQLFAIFGSVNTILVAPYIAKFERAHLLARYISLISGAAIVCAAIVGFALLFPGVLLSLLGPKYVHLRLEAVFTLIVSSIVYMSSMLFTLHSARKWVFWWEGITCCIIVSSVQICGVMRMDLSLTMGVIHLSMYSAVAALAVQAFTGVYGFRFGPPPGLRGEAA